MAAEFSEDSNNNRVNVVLTFIMDGLEKVTPRRE